MFLKHNIQRKSPSSTAINNKYRKEENYVHSLINHQYTMSNPNLPAEIIKSQQSILKSGHLHAFSILPVVLSFFVYPSLHLVLFHPHFDSIGFTEPQSNFALEIVVLLMFALFVDILYLFGVATITYSAIQVWYEKPVNLVSSIKSIRNSFLPLLSTLIVSQAFTILITLLLVMALVLVIQILKALGLYYSDYFFIWIVVGWLMLATIVIWLQIDWSLAYVVAVVESKWGFEAMKRSACLVKGKKWLATPMIINGFHGIAMQGWMFSGFIIVPLLGTSKADHQWMYLVILLAAASYFTSRSYHATTRYLVLNVVMCMYCKDFNGECLPLAEIRNEVTADYVSLPLDDDEN